MAELILNYTFDNPKFSNPDGTQPGAFVGATRIKGPGETVLGTYPRAVSLGEMGQAKITLDKLPTDSRQFCVRLAFRVTNSLNGRQHLTVGTKSPFTISTQPTFSRDKYVLNATVGTKNHGENGCSSHHAKTLVENKWYTASLVYDLDTVALFIDDEYVALRAFPDGTMANVATGALFLGSEGDGSSGKFTGDIAAFQLYKGIPTHLEEKLDVMREAPEWYLTHKYEEIKNTQSHPGSLISKTRYDESSGTYTDDYRDYTIVHHPKTGGAFAVRGAIAKAYRAMASTGSALGYPVSDEIGESGTTLKRNLFKNGGIYSGGDDGAVAVVDRIYLTYENLGGAAVWGLPLGPAKRIGDGLEQKFEKCRIYYKDGAPRACEVHGAILERYLLLGGPLVVGYPVGNEEDVMREGSPIGKMSEFEKRTIYWSSATGAFAVHGDIRRKYRNMGGPAGDLGFPTSNEEDVPDYSGKGRINSFQRGSVISFGSYRDTVVVHPFRIFINRLETRESEGIGLGENDLFFFSYIHENGKRIYRRRNPQSGNYGGHNHKQIDFTIPLELNPDSVKKTYVFSLDIRDSDPGKDDKLGKYSITLNAANAWGMRENQGIYDEAFSRVKSLTFSLQPTVDVSNLTPEQQWWAVENEGTPTITKSQFATTFRDVDSEADWWNVTDHVKTTFYHLLAKGIADGGNCFGMATEGIYARKGRSLFSLPIDRFTNWETVRKEFNIKQGYQIGAWAVWWFLSEVITGNTHDPKHVFLHSQSAFERGDDPVICLSQNYTFTEKAHCILPVSYDRSAHPWKIVVYDPNKPGQVGQVLVDPKKNTFKYVGSDTYTGSTYSGGRLHYMPWGAINSAARTPVWDAILLLL